MPTLSRLCCLILPITLIGCDGVYIPQSLPLRGKPTAGTQQEFDIKIISLNQNAVLKANETPYSRPVISGNNLNGPAVTRSEKSTVSERWPTVTRPPQYRLGPGDILSVSWQKPEGTTEPTAFSAFKKQTVTIGPDGSITFDGIGPVFLEGLTLEKARAAIQNAVREDQRSNFVFLEEKIPPSAAPSIYRLGAGDVLMFGGNQPEISKTGDIIEAFKSRALMVSSEGFVNLLDAGKVDVLNLSLSAAREAIELALIREGLDTNFDLIISEYNSQKILLGGAVPEPISVPYTELPVTLKQILLMGGVKPNRRNDSAIRLYRRGEQYQLSANKLLLGGMNQTYFAEPGDEITVEPLFNALKLDLSITQYNSQKVLVTRREGGTVIPLGPRPMSIQELLIQAGLNVTRNSNYLIRLIRNGAEYRISARRLLLENPDEVFYVQGGDNIIAEPLIYARQSAMITGAGTTPSLFALNAESRPSLADAIYGSKSLTKITANLRQVYVLRQNRKAYDAFQLDLSNPSRLILARNFEMRPDDIVYVSTQPLSEFNTIASQLIATFTGLQDVTQEIQGF